MTMAPGMNGDEPPTLVIDDKIPYHLSQYADFHLVEDVVFDFRSFNSLDPDSLVKLPVSEIVNCQNWSTSAEEDRNLAHLLMSELVMAAMEESRFDDLFDQFDDKIETEDLPNINEQNGSSGGSALDGNQHLFSADLRKQSSSFTSSPRAASDASPDSKLCRSESNQPGSEHDQEIFSPLAANTLDIGNTGKSRDSYKSDTPTPTPTIIKTNRSGAFFEDRELGQAAVKATRKPVAESVIKIYPIVCPSELARAALKTVNMSLINKCISTSFRDLNLSLKQNEWTQREIEDRVTWQPIVGNERVVEVCEKPVSAATRDKFIFQVQNLRCAFCGQRTDLRKLVTFQFCFYYGRYGCVTCITGEQNIIPARVLFHWDFRPFPVSNIGKEFLEKTKYSPLYHPKVLCPRFLEEDGKMAPLRKIEELRFKISLVMECFDACTEPDALKHRNKIRSHFHQTRTHLFSATGDYSLHDFVDIASTRVDNMEHYLNIIFAQTKHHCERCERQCRKRFSRCVLCKDTQLVFPWYVNSVVSCDSCHKLFHKKCCKSTSICPECSSGFVSTRAAKRLSGSVSNDPSSAC